MKLSAFNGGKSSRLAPQLIQPNEAVEFLNVDNTQAILAPVKSNTLVRSGGKSFYNFEGVWINSTEARDYVEWQGVLYWTGTSGAKKYNAGATSNLGITKPSTKPTVLAVNDGTTPDLEDGTFQYVYTYYNNNDGTESAPSPLSSEVTTTAGYVEVSGMVASADTQVTHIRLYRIGGFKTAFTLVVELVKGTSTYKDKIPSVDLLGGILESETNFPAPSGLKYLTEAYATFFGSVGATLHVSEVGNPNYWPYQLEFPKTITGMGAVQNGLLVFTLNATYLISGTDPTTFVRHLLSGDQGCKSHKSVQFIKNTLVWLSNDGLCSSTGGDLTVLTQDKLGKINLTSYASAIYDDVYYLFHTNGILALDSRFGITFKEFSQKDILGAGVFDDILYGSDSTNIYSMFTGKDFVPFTYKSPRLTDSSFINRKSYGEAYCIYEGELTIKIYISEELQATHQLSSETVSKAELGIPTAYNRGYSIQFEVLGGAIKLLFLIHCSFVV